MDRHKVLHSLASRKCVVLATVHQRTAYYKPPSSLSISYYAQFTVDLVD